MYVSARAEVADEMKKKAGAFRQSVVFLPDSGSAARLLSTSQVPKCVMAEGIAFSAVCSSVVCCLLSVLMYMLLESAMVCYL